MDILRVARAHGLALALVVLAGAAGCEGLVGPAGEGAVACDSSPLTATTASGPLPAGLPARLGVGLFEDSGGTWMKSSGVKWDYRYAYFTEGWVNNWGNGAADGSWGLNYMKDSDAAGFVPVVEWYVINGLAPAYDESSFYKKTTNASTMKAYFNEVKVLFQRAKDFGKPVVVLVEADGFAYLETQGKSATAAAAIASSGVAELASLPNTLAGWGLAFLQLRKAVGATNVVLGMHVSEWATGSDIAYDDVTSPLQPAVDTAYAFLAPLGLTTNVTGRTYDLLVGDPLDRDSDYYKTQQNNDRWWDASDTASITSKSFNRYAEWLRLWNVKTQKRWMLWQIPLGNSNQLDVANTGQARGGWKDNRAEYFFGASRGAHFARFANAGVIGLLFGRGEGTQSSYENDVYTDGQPFLKTHAGPFLSSGGYPLGTTSTTGDGGTGVGTGGGASTGGVSGGGASGGGDVAGSGITYRVD